MSPLFIWLFFHFPSQKKFLRLSAPFCAFPWLATKGQQPFPRFQRLARACVLRVRAGYATAGSGKVRARSGAVLHFRHTSTPKKRVYPVICANYRPCHALPTAFPARGGLAPSSMCETLSKGDRLSITPPVRAIGVRGDATPRIFSKNQQKSPRLYAVVALNENRESQFRTAPQEPGRAEEYGLLRR